MSVPHHCRLPMTDLGPVAAETVVPDAAGELLRVTSRAYACTHPRCGYRLAVPEGHETFRPQPPSA